LNGDSTQSVQSGSPGTLSSQGDDDWEELLFKTWVARVLNHTLKNVVRGYDVALGTLRDLVRDTQHKAAIKVSQSLRPLIHVADS
jgi:hypothetical protein